MSKRRQRQGYSQKEKKAFKKGMHFGWNKHKKMLKDIRSGKRTIKSKRRKQEHIAVIELPAPK